MSTFVCFGTTFGRDDVEESPGSGEVRGMSGACGVTKQPAPPKVGSEPGNIFVAMDATTAQEQLVPPKMPGAAIVAPAQDGPLLSETVNMLGAIDATTAPEGLVPLEVSNKPEPTGATTAQEAPGPPKIGNIFVAMDATTAQEELVPANMLGAGAVCAAQEGPLLPEVFNMLGAIDATTAPDGLVPLEVSDEPEPIDATTAQEAPGPPKIGNIFVAMDATTAQEQLVPANMPGAGIVAPAQDGPLPSEIGNMLGAIDATTAPEGLAPPVVSNEPWPIGRTTAYEELAIPETGGIFGAIGANIAQEGSTLPFASIDAHTAQHGFAPPELRGTSSQFSGMERGVKVLVENLPSRIGEKGILDMLEEFGFAGDSVAIRRLTVGGRHHNGHCLLWLRNELDAPRFCTLVRGYQVPGFRSPRILACRVVHPLF